MNARRIRWRGPAQQQLVQAELRRQLSAWLQAWSVRPEWLALDEAESASKLSLARRWLRARTPEGCVWLGAPAPMLAGVGDRLAGTQAGGGSEFASRIGERALRALLAQWLGAATPESVEFDEVAPCPEDLQARFGGLRYQVSGAGFSASVVVDNGACDRIAPTQPPVLAKLTPRAAALGAESVTLQVCLALGETSLAEAHALQVGDVLVSSTPLDRNFELKHPDSRSIAIGTLRRQGDRLALAVAASANPSRKQA